jgi:hypothetical protein
MKNSLAIIASFILLLLAGVIPATAQNTGGGSSSPSTASGSASLKYKMISGFKQPFNDDLQLHLSKGWTPVGGVAVTVWNGDLYFAQLVGRPVGSGQ